MTENRSYSAYQPKTRQNASIEVPLIRKTFSGDISGNVLIWLYNERLAAINWPCVWFLVVIIIVAVFSNGTVMYVYCKKVKQSTSDMFFFALAIFDCIGGFLLIFEVYDRRFPMYSGLIPALCKLFRYLVTSVNAVSAFTLVAIALDRYYKVCRPLKSYSYQKARNILVLIVILVPLVTIPMCMFYGPHRINIQGKHIYGVDCQDDDYHGNSMEKSLYYGILTILYFFLFISMTVLYFRIYMAICKWQRFNLTNKSQPFIGTSIDSRDDTNRSSNITDRKYESKHTCKISTLNTASNTLHNSARTSSFSGIRDTKENVLVSTCDKRNVEIFKMVKEESLNFPSYLSELHVPMSSTTNTCMMKETEVKILKNHGKNVRSQRTLSQTTFTFMMVTAALIISYIPYFTVEILNATGVFTLKELYQRPLWEQQLYTVFNSSFSLNMIINPVIYSIVNPKFRGELKKIFIGNTKKKYVIH